MSRLNTQTRLNQGPRPLEVPRSFLATPQRISTARPQDLSGLLNNIGRTAAAVSVNLRTRSAQDEQDEFTETLNSLNEKKAAFDRNEITSAELVQDYDSARERFQDPQQQSRLIAFGEPFKTRLVEETEARQTAAASGFLDTKLRELSFNLTNDEEFLSDVSDLPYAEQLEAIRGELYDSIPDEIRGTIDNDERLQAALTTQVLTLARTTSGIRSQNLAAEDRKIQQYAVASGMSEILEGGDIAGTISQLTTKQGIPAEDVYSGLADAIVGNIASATAAGSLVEASRYIGTAQDLLNNTPSLFGKERGDIAKAISLGIGDIGESTSTALTNAADIARLSGVSPEDIQGVITDETLKTAGTILGQEFETRGEFLAYLPNNKAEGKVHEELKRVMESVEVQEAARTKSVLDAVTATTNPDNATPADVTAPLSMGAADLTQFLDETSQRLVDAEAPPEMLALVDAAQTDRGALFQLLASNANNSSHAGRIGRAVGAEHLSTDTVSEEGLRQVFSTVEGLGGGDDIKLITGVEDWGKRYALGKAYSAFAATGEVDPNIYNEAYALYTQSQFETKSGDRQSLAAALQDKKVFAGITGASEGQFTDQQIALLLQTMNIGALKETGGRRDTGFITAKAKQALGDAGVYVLTGGGNDEGRSFIGLSQSKAIPEAIGQTTARIEQGLNNPDSTLDRFMATTLGGAGTKSVWNLALDKATAGLAEDSPMRLALTKEALAEARKNGTARIFVNSSQADRTTPIYLRLSDGKGTPRDLLIGEVNFGDRSISDVIGNYSSAAFENEEHKKQDDAAKLIQRYQLNRTYFQ